VSNGGQFTEASGGAKLEQMCARLPGRFDGAAVADPGLGRISAVQQHIAVNAVQFGADQFAILALESKALAILARASLDWPAGPTTRQQPAVKASAIPLRQL
jgi:hypothetical protein